MYGYEEWHTYFTRKCIKKKRGSYKCKKYTKYKLKEKNIILPWRNKSFNYSFEIYIKKKYMNQYDYC